VEIPIFNSFAPTEIIRCLADSQSYTAIFCQLFGSTKTFLGPENPHPWHNRTVEPGRIAPQLAIQGLFVHSARGSRGRVLSSSRDHKADDVGV
jgi:hypothetical protein